MCYKIVTKRLQKGLKYLAKMEVIITSQQSFYNFSIYAANSFSCCNIVVTVACNLNVTNLHNVTTTLIKLKCNNIWKCYNSVTTMLQQHYSDIFATKLQLISTMLQKCHYNVFVSLGKCKLYFS